MATSTVRRPGRRFTPRQAPSPQLRRCGAVYGIPTLAVDAAGMPLPGVVIVGYIGKTRQTVKQREEQHRDCQPFGDLIVGGSWVIEEGTWTEAELDAREQHYIRHGAVLVPGQAPRRPAYNIDFNRDNRARIAPWTALQQRQAREPGWEPPSRNSPPRLRPTSVGPRRPALWGRVRWTRRRVLAVARVCVWVALFAGFWFAGTGVWPGWEGPRNAAVGASVVSAALLCGRAYTSRPKRRRRGRRR